MGKKQQKIGAVGEQLAENRLRALGFCMVEKIGTPVRLLSVTNLNRKGIFRVIFGEKVSGDRRAIVPGSGRSVLIETKTVMDRNLRWSDLRPHQPVALDEHSLLGGISLLVCVHHSGVHVMKWPIDGFQKGKSITPDRAQELDFPGVNVWSKGVENGISSNWKAQR